MKFLNKVIDKLLAENKDLSNLHIVLPGKRPVVFLNKILKEKKYSGFLPKFFTVEDLIQEIAEKQELKGIGIWLFAYQIYREIYPSDIFTLLSKVFFTPS
jgi:predicted amino acid racemase